MLLQVRRVDGSFVERAAQDWPLPRTQWTKFHLDAAGGRLAREPAAGPQAARFAADGDGLTFWTPPLEREVEITGPAAARLTISSSTHDADIFLTLRVLDPDGTDVTFVSGQDPRGASDSAGCGPRTASSTRSAAARTGPATPMTSRSR